MATPKTRQLPQYETEETIIDRTFDGSSEDITELQRDLDSDLRFLFNEMGADPNDEKIYCKVLKEEKGEKEPGYLFSFNMSELPISDRLIKDYGTGTYVVRVIKNERLHRKFRIRVIAPNPTTQDAKGNSDLTNIMQTMFAQIEKNQQNFQQLLLSFANKQQVIAAPPPAQDMTTTMLTMVTIMEKLKSINGGGNETASIDMLLKGVELAKSVAGENSGESGLMDVVRDLIKSPIAEKAIASLASPQLVPQQAPQPINAKPPAPVHLATDAPKQIAESQPEVEQDMNTIAELALKNYVNQLIQIAKAGQDPFGYVYPIAANAPESMLRPIVERDDCVDYLATLNPEVLKHRLFFADLKKGLCEYYAEPLEDTEEVDNNEAA